MNGYVRGRSTNAGIISIGIPIDSMVLELKSAGPLDLLELIVWHNSLK